MKPKAAAASSSNMFSDYLAKLRNEVDTKRALIAAKERERRGLQQAVDDVQHEMDAEKAKGNNHFSWRAPAGLLSSGNAKDGSQGLWDKRQVASDALRSCDSAIDRARDDIKHAEYLIGAEDELKEAEAAYGACIAGATAAEKKFISANETCNLIEIDKSERAKRRSAVIAGNKATLRAHTEEAMAARAEGRAVPKSPVQQAVAPEDATDRDLDDQLAAAADLRDEYATELAVEVGKMEDLMGRLKRARFRSVDSRVKLLFEYLRPEFVEYAAARSAYAWGPELEVPTIRADEVDARYTAMLASIPTWKSSVDVEQRAAPDAANADTTESAVDEDQRAGDRTAREAQSQRDIESRRRAHQQAVDADRAQSGEGQIFDELTAADLNAKVA